MMACLSPVSVMHGGLPLFLVVALTAGPVLAQAPGRPPQVRAPERHCSEAGTPDRLTGLDPHGDLALASGLLVRLAGIRLPDEPALRQAATDWLRDRAGRKVQLFASPGRDRWNRAQGRVLLLEDQPRDLAEALVAAGLGLADPSAADLPCQAVLLAAEGAARERGLGVWAEDRYKPLPVGQIDRLREHVGRFVLVEGRIRSVGERQRWTYLNFGTDWASDFTIIIPKKAWDLMADKGLTAATLTGRRIRARGLLEERQGPSLTIALPDMIENLNDGRARR
jgi:endonuclease YncB( thermonuclease family)